MLSVPAGTCCCPLPQPTWRQQLGECWCSTSGITIHCWHKDGRRLGGLQWQRGHSAQEDPGSPNPGLGTPCAPILAPTVPLAAGDAGGGRRESAAGAGRKGGFGAGRWELLGQEMKVAATGRCNVLHSRGSAVAGVPSRHTFPTRGRCAGGASGAGPVHLSGLAGSRSRARRRGGVSPSACRDAEGGQRWGGTP